MNSVKVSVIVPCYKVEAYLERSIGSLARQSLRELEIIAVDDGSPDKSGVILERLKGEIGPRMQVFHKENGGLSDARNFGLEKATGEYIAFLDADDWADLDLYETLYQKALETGADAVACPIRYVWENKDAKTVSCGIPAFAEGEELKSIFTRFYPAVWNKLYKRELLEKSGVRFKKGVFFEDVEFSHRLFPHFQSLASVEMAAINYLQRDGSITAKPDRRLFDYLLNFESILTYFKENGFFEPWKRELEYASTRYLLATFLKRAAPLSNEDFQVALDSSLSFLDQNFPDRKMNPYLFKSGLKGLYLRFFSREVATWMRKRGLL